MAPDESPDHDGRLSVSRRSVLAAAGGLTAAGAVVGQSTDDGNLNGGSMSLNEAYNVSGDLWIGPRSARDTVDPDVGRVYIETDTQLKAYADGDAWTIMGHGTADNPVPETYTEVHNTELVDYNTHPVDIGIYKDGDRYDGTVEAVAVEGTVEQGRSSDGKVAFQSAFDAVTEGTKIQSLPGEYVFESKAQLNTNNVVVDGTVMGTGQMGNLQGENTIGCKLKANMDDAILSLGEGNIQKPHAQFKNLYFVGTGTSNGVANVFVSDSDQVLFKNCFFSFSKKGIESQGNAYVIDNCIFIDLQTWGVKNGRKAYIHNSKFLNGAGTGIKGVDKLIVDNCDFHSNGGTAIETGNKCIVNSSIFDWNMNYRTSIGVDVPSGMENIVISTNEFDGIVTGIRTATDQAIIGPNAFNGCDTGIEITSSATDTRISPLCSFYNNSTDIDDSGTRTRWGNVIAGGPLGGTDIGSLTGASTGDIAAANGTTGSADALYRLKSNGDWQALHDPTTTITPS